MAEGKGHVLTLNCECGNSFEDGLAGKDLETAVFSCPVCERDHRLNEEQIAGIIAAVERARKEINDALARAVKGSTILSYRPK